MTFPVFSRSLNKAKRSLPKEPVQKHVIAKALFEDSIQATPKKIRLLSAWSNIHEPKRHNIGYPTIQQKISKRSWIHFCVAMI